MDISKLFAKKRDLGDQYNNSDEQKQLREESSASSSSPNSPRDVFRESLISPGCMKIKLNCLQNLDKQAKELYILAQSNKEKRSEASVRSDWVYQFHDKILDDYDKDIAENEKLINNFRKEISAFSCDIEQ